VKPPSAKDHFTGFTEFDMIYMMILCFCCSSIVKTPDLEEAQRENKLQLAFAANLRKAAAIEDFLPLPEKVATKGKK
jgi:hypothetical protein